MYDSSIHAETKQNGYAGDDYKCEIVSPICVYDDIETIQEIIRELRRKGAIANASCGIHYGKKNVMLSYSAFSAVWHALTLTVD